MNIPCIFGLVILGNVNTPNKSAKINEQLVNIDEQYSANIVNKNIYNLDDFDVYHKLGPWNVV